ncbi:MAG: thioredoxin domain-containing protein [bacterium]|nr:thioredoxin domain-containing protein [bacterium]
MKEFILRNKAFLGISAATLAILLGGVFLNSKNVSETVLISEDSQKSDPSAPLKLVEFGDYQCPACAVYHPFVKQLLSDFPGKINFVYRHFPLPIHKNAVISAYAAEAAGVQGKFWEMHNKIYETQNVWSNSESPADTFVTYAADLGLNIDKFLTDIDSETVKSIVKRGLSDGNLAGINSTPTFFLDGVEMPLFATYDELKKTIEDKLKTQ